MDERTKKFLIITSATGGGHTSAAAAIAEGLNRFSATTCLVNVVKAIEDSHFLNRKLADFYNYLLRYHQPLMKYYYSAIERFRPNESNLLYRFCANYLRQLFEKYCPQIVISVHPMTQHIFARVMRELGLLETIPLVTVVTDPCYGFWSGWACQDVSLYLVATEDARRQLIDYGIDPEKIKICGIPIHPKFHFESEQDKTVLRTDLGLDPEKFTVFVNAGWVGGGNIPHIFEQLVDEGRDLKDAQAIFVAGRNQELMNDAIRVSKRAAFPVKVIGYTDAMEKVMQAADVMVSKLGGLTTFEALASRLPIIADTITPPMPQEHETANLIARNDAGILLHRASDLAPIVRRLISQPAEHAAMRMAATRIAIPDATRRIVQEISRTFDGPGEFQVANAVDTN